MGVRGGGKQGEGDKREIRERDMGVRGGEGEGDGEEHVKGQMK